MYLEHYGLKETPFSITPDPRYVFLSERRRTVRTADGPRLKATRPDT